MAIEQDRGIADQVRGGLVPPHQEEEGEGDQLRLAQALPVDLGREQCTQQVVAGIAPPSRQDLREVACELDGRSDVRRVAVAERGRVELGHPVGHLLEPPLVLDGHAEQLGDHDRRQRPRELAHEIELAAPLDAVEQRARDVADAGLEARDAAGRERAIHERAELRVARTVRRDEERQLLVEAVVAFRDPHHDALAQDEQVGRLEGLEHVVVAGASRTAAWGCDGRGTRSGAGGRPGRGPRAARDRRG